jgi:hypothetical protein
VTHIDESGKLTLEPLTMPGMQEMDLKQVKLKLRSAP